VGDDLGVGVARKAHATILELAPERDVVLDDPVVDDGDLARDVRVGVRFARATVRGPARVADPRRPHERGFQERAFEMGELADRSDDLDTARPAES
jgi:hypothetical protein